MLLTVVSEVSTQSCFLFSSRVSDRLSRKSWKFLALTWPSMEAARMSFLVLSSTDIRTRRDKFRYAHSVQNGQGFVMVWRNSNRNLFGFPGFTGGQWNDRPDSDDLALCHSGPRSDHRPCVFRVFLRRTPFCPRQKAGCRSIYPEIGGIRWDGILAWGTKGRDVRRNSVSLETVASRTGHRTDQSVSIDTRCSPWERSCFTPKRRFISPPLLFRD